MSIPELPPGGGNLTAALAYAAGGFYVGPARRGTKDPGSILGKGWQHKTSRDPKVIAAWFAGSDHDIFIHCGRSGAVMFDVDDIDKVPPVLAKYLNTAPYQSTRPDTPGRGHYAFAMPPGRTIGNSGGRLGGAWGEVRGLNGVVIAEPSHHKDGGEYRWKRTGVVPVLPGEITEPLDDASPASDAATDVQVAAFLAEHRQSTRPKVLQGLVSSLRKRFDTGESRHVSTVPVLAGAMKEARAGYYPAQLAVDTLADMFLAEVANEPISSKQGAPRIGTVAVSEFDGILAWAVGQALAADLDEVRARVGEKMFDNQAWMNSIGGSSGQAGESKTGFWDRRDVLAHIYTCARARRVSPWAVLGVTMARAVAATPPDVVLPALVGSRMSLNLFVGLVGPSGGGKDSAEGAARDVFTWGTPANPLYRCDEIPEVPIGTGEGVARTYRPLGTKPDNDNPVKAAIFTAMEIDSWAALASRTGSTLTAVLRTLFTGGTVGFGNAGKDTRVVVEAHSYRACGIFGVQPLRSGPLLQAADGGLPQRFVFVPTNDPDAPDDLPAEPHPLPDPMPDWQTAEWVTYSGNQIVLRVPDTARREIDTHRLAVLRGDPDVDPLDGHALLTRLKVAAALMVLCGQTALSEEDWELAGVVMAVSVATRQVCKRALDDQSRRTAQARAHAAADREEVISDRKLRLCKESIVRWLSKAGEGGHVSRRDLRGRLRSDQRDNFDVAVAELIDEGKITKVDLGRGTGYTVGPPVHPSPPQSTCADNGGPNGGPKVHPYGDASTAVTCEKMKKPKGTQHAR